MSAFPKMLHEWMAAAVSRRGILLLIVAIALVLGIPYLWTPSREASFSFSSGNLPGSGDSRVVRFYKCEVGNTGLMPLEGVDVVFSRAVMDCAVIKPYAKRFGITELTLEGRADGDTVVYSLGPVNPGVRIDIYFAAMFDSKTTPPGDNAVLKAVTAVNGTVREGDPAFTTFFRIIYRALLSLFA